MEADEGEERRVARPPLLPVLLVVALGEPEGVRRFDRELAALQAVVALAALRDPRRGALRLLITSGEDDGRVLARAEDRLGRGKRRVQDGLVVDDRGVVGDAHALDVAITTTHAVVVRLRVGKRGARVAAPRVDDAVELQ